MKPSYLSQALAAVAAASLAAATSLPARAADAVLYNGGAVATAGITLGGWGTGSTKEDSDVKQEGDRSIKIVTRDFYQGGRLDFQKPQDLAAIVRQPNAYLSLSLKMSPTARILNVAVPAGTSTTTGTAGGYGSGMYGGGSGSAAGTATGATTLSTIAVQIPKVTKLRLLLVSGKRSLELYSVGELKTDDAGWAKIGIPLMDLAPKLATGTFPIDRMLISADSPDTLYLSQMSLVNDNTEIAAKVERFNADPTQADFKVNKPIIFTATAESGITPIKFCWDFDASDGIQEEATGARVEHAFAKEGKYTVTLTAKPADGSTKKPDVQTFEIDVAP